MAIAEGVENALSVVLAAEMPWWAALSANGIAELVLPPIAQGLALDIIMAADPDAPGMIGARRAARPGNKRAATCASPHPAAALNTTSTIF
jgi:hypothetical protein